MRKAITAFVRYPFYAQALVFLTLVFGIAALFSIRKASFPITESRLITVSVTYQGATPKEMEEGVTTLVENALRGVVGVKEISSKSMENQSLVSILIRTDYDVDVVLNDIKNAIDKISNFPAGAENPVITKTKTTSLSGFLALTQTRGPEDIMLLKRTAQRIEDDFLGSGLISQVMLIGYPTRMEMSVEVREEVLQRYGMSFSEIKNAIAANNLDIYGGKIKNPREEIKINSRYRSVSAADVERIVVRANANGDLIRVGDVADVRMIFEDIPTASYVDGERNVMFRIDNLATEDLERISAYLHDYIREFNERGNGYRLEFMHDFLETLRGQLNILYSNGLAGMLLVVLCLSLFLSFRLSVWVAWGIPMAFLSMFVVAVLMGLTMNFISVFGMILIVGILVDDGIVISENIYTRFQQGLPARKAAVEGTMEVLPAVLVSVLTTLVAFLPILFIQGNLEMMYEMAVVVIVCLLFSLLESMFMLPAHCASAKVLAPPSATSFYGRIRSGFDRGMRSLCERVYLPFVRWALGHRSVVLSSLAACFLLTAGLIGGGRIGFTILPSMNEDSFNIELAMKPGTNYDQLTAELKCIESVVWRVDSMLMERYREPSFIKLINMRTGTAFSGSETGSHAGSVVVFLRRLDQSEIGTDEIKACISKELGTVPSAYKFAIGAGHRFGAQVSISLFGYDMETLERASSEFQARLRELDALYNVIDNAQLGGQEVRVRLKPVAYSLGLTQQQVMGQVREAFYGSLAQRLQEGKDEVWFYVRYPDTDRRTMGDLVKMMIRTSNGVYPLGELCDLDLGRSVLSINHYNGRKEIRVDAYMEDASASVIPVMEEIEQHILPEILARYPDITYMQQGQMKDMRDEMQTIKGFYMIALFVIVMILVIYLRSTLQMSLVVLMIPVGCMSAIWGHWIEGVPLSMMTIWGMVALSGTIINDAVVFISRYNDCLKLSMKVDEAIVEAARSRFRPIILTSLTTTAGLFPLIREGSSDARFVLPMAITLGYGILFGTFFILTCFPVLIKMANRFKLFFLRLRHPDATPESAETAVKDLARNTDFNE